MRHTQRQRRSAKRKKEIQGGASEDVQATKVSPISSRHQVLQSMLSEYINSDRDDLNHLRPEKKKIKLKKKSLKITVHATQESINKSLNNLKMQ